MTLLLDEVVIAAARLAEAGVESPRSDAEVIAAHVHGVRRGELHLVPDTGFDPRFWNEIARREAREPLQHITGLTHLRYTRWRPTRSRAAGRRATSSAAPSTHRTRRAGSYCMPRTSPAQRRPWTE